MAYKHREEIVGKRFLSVSGFTKLKLGKIAEWGWRAGVIRAASHKDSSHPDLQVLVEYDDVEWHRREWISIYKDSLFSLFLVEHSLVWADRVDPLSSTRGSTVLWPALSFTPLVATVDLAPNQQPLEFLLDRELIFRDKSRLQPFQEWDPKLPGLRDYPELKAAVRRWSELQDGQRILVTTPSVLVGYRVEVYRAEGTTQWYTAVIVSYNEATRDLTVTDDTVLEEHNEDPSIVQMRLIGDGVVESIMKGENVGITARRSRSSAVLTQHQQQQPSRVGRSSGVTPSGGGNSGALPVTRKLRTCKLPASTEQPPAAAAEAATHTPQPGGNNDRESRVKTRAERRRRNAESVAKTRSSSSANKEDLENKGNKKKTANRGAKKKVLEEANNSKLRRHVQVRVEDCLHRTSSLRSCKKDLLPPAAETEECQSAKKDEQPAKSEPASEEVKEEEKESDDVLRTHEETTKSSSSEEVRTEEKESESASEEVVRTDENESASVKTEEASESVRTEGNKESESAASEEVRTDEKQSESASVSVRTDDKVSESVRTDEKENESASEEVRTDEKGSESANEEVRTDEKGSEEVITDEKGSESSNEEVRTDEKRSESANEEVITERTEEYGVCSEDDSGTPPLQEEVSVIVEDRTSDGERRSATDDDVRGRMDGDSGSTALLRFPDDRSDSGVSSLRSGSSGDERSGSRSSSSESVSVWRDPILLQVAEPQIRHINSVQHHTLLMSHPSTPAAAASAPQPSSSSAAQALALAQAHYPPPPPLLSPHPLHHVPHLPPPSLYSDMLWGSKRYPPLPVGTHLLAPAHPAPEDFLAERERDRIYRERQNQEARELEKQHKEREKERERLERERERQERDKLERERQEREKMERERMERLEHDRQERERIEKQRAAEQAVHKHFEESLRLANQKRNLTCWSLINSLPPPRGSATEEDRKRVVEHDVAQQRLMAERFRQERYFTPGVQRPPSGPKVEYPPPAHSRVSSGKSSDKPPAGHAVLPKAEPNFNLFGYPAYHPGNLLPHDSSKAKQEQLKASPSSLVTAAKSGMDRDLPNPPPLMSDIKNSVIVKNEGKVPPPHSPSPKYLPPTQHKAYEYRSPTQSPHHLAPRHSPSPHHPHMAMEPQNLVGKGMHRSSPHALAHRQSPQQPHPSPPEQRYGGSGGPSPLPYGPSKTATVGSYPYPSPAGHVTTTHYALATGGSVTAGSKPKVSSPAPPHIYGKPGITTGTPVCRAQDSVNSGPLPLTSKAPLTSSVSPSPYQQMSHHHPPPHQTTAGPPPPPAHSRGTSGLYDRLYAGGPGLAVKPPPQHQGSSPPSASAAPLTNPRSSPLQIPHQPSSHLLGLTPVFQTQPLDLGVSSDRGNNRDELAGSPKRKGIAPHHSPNSMPVDANKKRRCEQPQVVPLSQPLLSRVSEPSPLIASAATTITTVVNTAAYCTPAATSLSESSMASTTVTASPCSVPVRTGSGDGSVRPSSTCSSPGVTAMFPPQRNSPVPLAPPSSPSLNTPSKPAQPPPSSVDSDKSNSPGPVRPAAGSSYPVHKLKKAWLQRHSGEDGTEDTMGIVGTGSCVTLPLNLGTNTTTPTPASKEGMCKGKPNPNKGNNRKAPPSNVTVNGHASDIPTSKQARQEDSSSSDAEREQKTPPKRKPPKMKRKKGGGAARKAAEEKRKKLAHATQANSESGSDSDKESLSDKDSDSGASTNQSKKSANGGGGNSTSSTSNPSKEPRKRGRRPKSSKNDKGEEPRQKRSRDDPPAPQRDPFRKPPVSQLKKTGESFLQDGPCHEVAPKLAKCRECRWTPNQRSRNMPNIFCRFYAFRRLRYTKNGQLAIAGFSDPHRDASEDDLKLWLPIPDNPPADLDIEMSRFLLSQVGDQFCDLLEQERESLAVHMSEEKVIAWKRVVQGVREMCDVCETTLFNFHWACSKCGFVVCIDCYKGRKNGEVKSWGESGKDRDDFSWLLCTNRQAHEQEKLMLTQIIAGDSLMQLGKKVHEMRVIWDIPQFCGCRMSKEAMNGVCKDLLKVYKNDTVNGLVKQEKSEAADKEKKNGTTNGLEDQNSPLNWLADVALSKEDKKPSEESGTMSSDSEDKDDNFSTLRELLIRPSHKPNGSRSASPANNSTSSTSGGLNSTSNSNTATTNSTTQSAPGLKISKRNRLNVMDLVVSTVIEESVVKEPAPAVTETTKELKHFVRRYMRPTQRHQNLPIRIMTHLESQPLYPDVPHKWLCDGKLLRLTDPNCEGNYPAFQDQWRRGQPVLVSDVAKNLDMSLWHPDSFARDFGDDKNDLVNCMTGNVVPNQPMRKFWEGFEHLSRRLKDDKGNPMLLKLKDWPPGEDFAEMLPSRFTDLMKVLPLSEYTHRTGRLNLASRLPDCFVRPDLGPKMYNAYGSALYPMKGTTNLHLDISDAVNVMVYVGIPKDSDNEEHIKEAFRAIDEAGCDILTRRRVREKGELPGALWHIYNSRDADKIRDLLNKVAIENGARLEPHHDPIHDQSWYLDSELRERLYTEYGVEGYAIVQCLGDSVFIPAGAPHQVRNLHNCIKVAEDFVSPENVSHCFHLTQEFRDLSDTHSNHEDKLQIKNIIYHAVKDSLSVLTKLVGSSEEYLAKIAKGDDEISRAPVPSSNGSSEVKVKEEPNTSAPSNGGDDNVEIKKDPET